LLHYYLKNADPLHKVTIVPHGQALGVAFSLPETDAFSRSVGWLRDRIAIIMGGFAAEQIIFGETTTGAQNDIEQATDIARKMICEWGMSAALGPIAYGQKEEPIFLGKEIARHKDYSEETARAIDQEVRAIVEEGAGRAKSLLTENKDRLVLLAKTLIEKETLDDAQVRELLGFPPRKKQEE
jgi:cell division protease FtsH